MRHLKVLVRILLQPREQLLIRSIMDRQNIDKFDFKSTGLVARNDKGTMVSRLAKNFGLLRKRMLNRDMLDFFKDI